MLTLEGYIGLSIKDKYQLKTRNWNKVVLFDWKSIFDGWIGEDAGDGDYRTSWELFKDNFFGIFNPNYNSSEAAKKSTDSYIQKALSLIENDLIYVDDDGNYYTKSQKESESDKLIVGTPIILPVKPSDILKLMCNGGSLGNLVLSETDLESYRGTSFYNTIAERKNVSVDLAFIKAFLDKHKNVVSNGWTVGNIEDTAIVDEDLSQVSTSDIKYVYDTLSKVAVKVVKKSSAQTEYVYNYKFNINDNKTVDFFPIEIKADAQPKQTYFYYGNGDNSSGTVLKSFSANTDILTAFLTGDTSYQEKLSNLNLVTGEPMVSDILSEEDAKQNLTMEGKYKYNYDTVVFAPIINAASAQGATAKWEEAWREAKMQCYKAEATVTGYCGLCPGDYVQIIVLPTKVEGSSDPVIYHHSSGLYYILKQTDIIENGTYTSKLELVKNVAAIGNATVKYNNVNNVTLEDYKSGQTILEQQMDAFNNPNKIY